MNQRSEQILLPDETCVHAVVHSRTEVHSHQMSSL